MHSNSYNIDFLELDNPYRLNHMKKFWREAIANKAHPTVVLKNIVAYVSYHLTGIGTLGKLHTLQAFRKSYSSSVNSASDLYFVLSTGKVVIHVNYMIQT